MTALVNRKETAKQTPTLYLVYGYREIDEPNRWYVGSCLYMREQARDNRHRRMFGDGKKFRRELKKIADGRCFDELVQKVILEIVWGTPQECIDRENLHMDRLDSIKNGFNSNHAGLQFLSESLKGMPCKNKGNPAWNKGKPSPMKGIKGKKHSEETRRKISEALKGKKISKKHRRKISEAQKGKKISQETKRKISEALKGKKKSQESVRKQIISNNGYKHSDESKQKISDSKKGKKRNPFSKEWIQNMSNAQKTRWVKYKTSIDKTLKFPW